MDCWSFNGRGLSPLDLYRSPGAHCSYIQYLSILGVFTLCHSGAASLTGATKSWLKRVVPSVP
ncbi:TPA: hypothetical protein MIM87_02180 [Klebsiella variicola]|nr:hypothetical protein C2U49_18990 [Klebsiella pneumoniae]POW78833.1 hypothetical protein C3413_19360 [Klebsiella pneumoniae]HBX9995919.1 hypothetical protein [Klebsiella variicola]